MTPYYDDGTCVIYHGKAEVVLPALPRDSVDLLLTDPPYGIGYQSNRGHNHAAIAGDDGTLDVPGVLTTACAALRRGRHAYVFGPIDLSATPLTAQVELVWDKGIVGMGNLELPWATSHEPITFAVYEPSKANREKGYGRLAARRRDGRRPVRRLHRPHRLRPHRRSHLMAHAYHSTVLRDLTPDDVNCGTLRTNRGYVDLGPDVTIHGTIAELRAVAVEIDRQLARLEVEHRIDQAVSKCGTCGDTGEVIGSGPFHYAVHPCPACKEGDQ